MKGWMNEAEHKTYQQKPGTEMNELHEMDWTNEPTRIKINVCYMNLDSVCALCMLKYTNKMCGRNPSPHR